MVGSSTSNSVHIHTTHTITVRHTERQVRHTLAGVASSKEPSVAAAEIGPREIDAGTIWITIIHPNTAFINIWGVQPDYTYQTL